MKIVHEVKDTTKDFTHRHLGIDHRLSQLIFIIKQENGSFKMDRQNMLEWG